MTFKEALAKEKLWHKRAIIISMFHYKMLLRHKSSWSMRKSAKRLGISLGMISESLALSKAMMNNTNIETMTRSEALRWVRYGYRK